MLLIHDPKLSLLRGIKGRNRIILDRLKHVNSTKTFFLGETKQILIHLGQEWNRYWITSNNHSTGSLDKVNKQNKVMNFSFPDSELQEKDDMSLITDDFWSQKAWEMSHAPDFVITVMQGFENGSELFSADKY